MELWEQIINQLGLFLVLAIILERSLYQVFHTKLYGKAEIQIDDFFGGDFVDLKPWISIAVCIGVVFLLDLDMLALMFSRASHPFTLIITGLFISGGATAFYHVFRQIKEAKKELRQAKIEAKKQDLKS